jgi:hypothetical protein
MNDQQMTAQIQSGQGFIAALDQSGGSTPKALKGYGVEENAYSGDEEMFGLIHQMRSRIITSPVFNGDKVIGAILFERTMDGQIDGKPVRTSCATAASSLHQDRQGSRRRGQWRAADEADAGVGCAAEPRQGPRRVRYQGTLGDQSRQP